MPIEGSFEKLTGVSRSTRATRQRAVHLRAEAAALILRSQEAIRSARELSQTSNLLIAICLRSAFSTAWRAREPPSWQAE